MVTILVWDFAWWSPGRYLKVAFLDVGQGNAVVIQFPDHKTMWVEKSHLRQRSTDRVRSLYLSLEREPSEVVA